MGLDFAILFALALAFWWLTGRVIDDVLDAGERAWSNVYERKRR